MSLLKIEDATFENVEGKLVAKEILMVNYKKEKEDDEIPTMKIIPIVGDKFTEFVKLSNVKPGEEAKEAETKLVELLIEHIVMPKFTPTQFKIIKPTVLESMMQTVMVASGIPLDKLKITKASE